MRKKESETIAFGAAHIDSTTKFKLAIKIENACGVWTVHTGNVKNSFDIELSHKKCPELIARLSYFEETCQKSQRFAHFLRYI